MSNKENKPRLSLIPKEALWSMGEAFTFGEVKHGTYSWRNDSHTLTEILDKAMRHIVQFSNGENVDEQSKVLHLGSALADLAIAVDLFYNSKHLDDRFKGSSKETKEEVQEDVDVIIEESDMRYLTQGTRVIGVDGRDYVTAVNGTFPVKEGDRLIYGS